LNEYAIFSQIPFSHANSSDLVGRCEEGHVNDRASLNEKETLEDTASPASVQSPTPARPFRRHLAVALLLLGLVAAPATALAAPDAQEGGYVVQRGDTLANIAARLGVSMSTLADVNGILNANVIYVGQVLVVPAELVSAATGVDASAQSTGSVYVIRRGDSLSSIAARHGTSVAALMSANGISNANRIYAGQRLVIDGSLTPDSEAYAAPDWAPTAGRWIDIDLSEQRLTAYQGDTTVFSTLVSTGTANHPTPVGEFAIRTKIDSQTMSGADYYLPNVQYVMYFAGANAIHGTYWHSNFGHPMSHGCVNLPNPDAAWLYSWASIGTPVVTHY
jgi:LysM repeat protein